MDRPWRLTAQVDQRVSTRSRKRNFVIDRESNPFQLGTVRYRVGLFSILRTDPVDRSLLMISAYQPAIARCPSGAKQIIPAA
jgi:hypothetical protein